MAWVRLDDGFPTHPKVSRLDPQAFMLWAFGLAYCCRHLTDGLIHAHVLQHLAPRVRHTAKATGTLVQAGLWHPTDGGYQVTNFLDWNADRTEIERKKSADRARKKAKNRPDFENEHGNSERNPSGIRQDSRMGGDSFVHGESLREPSNLEAGFAEWWRRYPRRVGKAAAWREWQRLRPVPEKQAEMLAVLELQKRSPDWTKESGKYIPHPRTYLHQGRFDDALEDIKEPPAGPSWRRYDECAQCGAVHEVGVPCRAA